MAVNACWSGMLLSHYNKTFFSCLSSFMLFILCNIILTLSVPNLRRHLSPFSFLTNYRLKRSLYVKLKDWMSNSADGSYEPSHLDLCCLQKPVIIACGSERVNVCLFLIARKDKLILKYYYTRQLFLLTTTRHRFPKNTKHEDGCVGVFIAHKALKRTAWTFSWFIAVILNYFLKY